MSKHECSPKRRSRSSCATGKGVCWCVSPSRSKTRSARRAAGWHPISRAGRSRRSKGCSRVWQRSESKKGWTRSSYAMPWLGSVLVTRYERLHGRVDRRRLDELTLLWLQATDPNAVTQAEATIYSLLRRAPLQHGAEISEGLRELTVPPLRVLYSV